MVRKNIRSILGRRDDSEESGGQTPQDFGAADLEDKGRKREENNRRGGRRWLSRCCFTSCTPMETCDSVGTGEDEVDSRIHKPESGDQAESDGQTPGNLEGENNTADLKSKSDGETPGNFEGENTTADLKSKSDDPYLPMKKDGSLDWRRKENRKLLGTNEKGQPVNVTGTPDRRCKETKDEQARGQSSSKSGRTPSITPVKKDESDDPYLPMKKDGSLDWRRKENRKLLGTNEKGQPVNVTEGRKREENNRRGGRRWLSRCCFTSCTPMETCDSVGTGEDEVDSRIHKPASTRKDEVYSPIARKPDYNAYLNDLREASQAGFDDLCNKANQLQPHIPPLTMKEKGKFCLNIDESSQKRIPIGKLNGDYVALRTFGDGNCFYRTASILAFGDESKHLEMRVRILVELACNIQYYLTVPNVEERIRVIEEYLLGTSSSKALDTSLIKVAFKGEVRETCEIFNWASHWHVEALPTVIRRPVKVVFPEGSGRIEEIFNDDIHPRDGRLILEPLVIMWTSANPSPRGGPDHFVPLVPAGEVCSLGKGCGQIHNTGKPVQDGLPSTSISSKRGLEDYMPLNGSNSPFSKSEPGCGPTQNTGRPVRDGLPSTSISSKRGSEDDMPLKGCNSSFSKSEPDLWRQYEDVLAQSQSQPTREQIKPTTSFQETTV